MTDLKASPCGEMSDQGQGPSQKLLRDLLERRGLIEGSSIRNEKARVAEKELRRNMYHNTQVMFAVQMKRPLILNSTPLLGIMKGMQYGCSTAWIC